MAVNDLSTVNAVLNGISAIFLLAGFVLIRRGEREKHRNVMVTALFFSALFLISYLIYHYHVGSVPYPHHDWTRPVYFIILIPHIIMAAVMTPFILIAVWYAFNGKYDKHRRLVRWVWPVWMYVSVSGVAIYLMLYRL